MKPTRGQQVFQIFNYILIALIVFTTLYPFMHELSISFSNNKEAYRPGFHFFPNPNEITFTAYKTILESSTVWTGYLNTIIRTACGTTLSLLVYGLLAYPLSKERMPFVNVFTKLLIFTMLFQGGMVPTYIMMRKLNLVNTRLILILQGVVSAFNIIVMRNFFKSIPESLEESAKIDGANDLTIFFRIILPLSKAVLATIGLWVAVWHWNAWFDGMIYIRDEDKQVLQVILRDILIMNQGDLFSDMRMADNRDFSGMQLKSAMVIVSIVPIMMVYPFIQKYFVKGIMLGAVKG